MTFTEIVAAVADRLNLTSADALTRIGKEVNERYKWMASDVGFSTIARTTVSATTVIGTRSLAFGSATNTGVEKILSIYTADGQPLGKRSFDELRNMVDSTTTDPALYYADMLSAPRVQTVFLSSTPGSVYTLTADVLTNMTTLAGTTEPAFPDNFHNILIYGAMATELDKMEKYDLSEKKEKQFEGRLSELKLYMAVSGYLDIYQGKR